MMSTLWLVLGLPSAATVYFRAIGVKDGLADNFVRDIMADSEGYVWLSTINGVSRYDGYRFLNFQPKQLGGRTGDVAMVRETADSTLWMLITSGELFTYHRTEQKWQMDGNKRLSAMGIKGNHIHLFDVDDDGGLWVVTEYGLWHQDFQHPTGSQTFAPSRRIDTIAQPILHIVANNGTTLIITTDYYIYKVSPNGKLTLLAHHPRPGNDDRDTRAMLDSRMNLWLYHSHESAGTLWVLSLSNNEWYQPEILSRLGNSTTINAIAEDSNGRLWISTGNRGVIISENGSPFELSTFTPQGAQKLNLPHATCFYADRNNTMWAGSAKLGAVYADLNCPEFIHITNEDHEDVSALMEDMQGNIWIGFDGEGIIMQGKDGSIRTFSSLQGQIPSDNVTALATDGHGHILVGTYGGGIAQFNGHEFIPLYTHIDQLRYVKALSVDRYGSLWVATVDKGVVRITDHRFINYSARNSPLHSDGIICLAYDAPADRMYIGTSIGLAAYDCSQGNFIKDAVLDSLKGISVTALLVDGQGRLWIGSRNGLWIKGRTLQHLTTEQGLSHNVVRALTMSGGATWASTDNGLTNITIQDNEFKCRPYFDSDGLEGITFSNNAALTTHDGSVLLGSLTGYICIASGRPPLGNNTSAISSSLKVAFTEFRINGNPVVKSPQGFTIAYGERLGISISMMVPVLSQKTRYLYRFKGEDDWMRAPGNMLYFASLMPGTHVLQVKAELPGMTTTEVSELTFRVLRPLWLSNGAIASYLLLFAAIAWFSWRAIRRRQKRELAIKQMELNLRKYEMEEQKISFFTNISHDIKTPLTMVMAPLEKICNASLPTAVRTEIDVARQNARQLYDLVLELLDFQRLDEGKEKLKLSHGELVSFVRTIAHSFDYIAKRRNITINALLPTTAIEMLFDENKMRRILTNLLSNAFKYNVENGSVTVSLTHKDSEIRLSVADTGIGIKNKQSIFERFVQETHGQEQEGSGLGLHIVRQYVDMMGGTIMVTDNKPVGTVFTVTIPTPNTIDTSNGDNATDSTRRTTLETEAEKQPPTILVIEDNIDARLFLQRSLENEYRILLAANGKEAFSLLGKNDNVNLIISDVMMPVMDGIEFVRLLRKNIRYSHIPVILLTAKSGEDDIIAGLEEGVADYLTKPYSLAVLRLRIGKILEWTNHIYEQVATGIEISPSEITVSSLDTELISQVIAEIEAHIADPSYSVVQLSSAVGMTRGTLYKKLMAIVGKSPVEFIRIVRLKRGKSLLEQGRTNISEVADKVGISPKMFAQYFRETFGETPSDFLKHQAG